ncbi:S1/P1 nuclease [Rhizoctonia solani]|uniref:S1/P1 nuclease n=1 Tax=Rhizoctonia solani TaxID=456999 RepID=A0A8H8P424_9AGAM|nr:S1/P1 nuclease [Rhizoctonia solani]QRW23541.1 S1/P1 nuclease [Rhizoctonia solani]
MHVLTSAALVPTKVEINIDMRSLLAGAATIASLATPALSWGAAGHEITATIAQMHLLPSAQDEICKILPANFNCRLSGIAAWADKIRGLPQFRWTSGCTMSIQAMIGHPRNAPLAVRMENGSEHSERSGQCHQGCRNAPRRDYALRFLVHFMGDIHMPLHLTGRDKGGNEGKAFQLARPALELTLSHLDRVRYDGRITNLHSLWDGRLIAQRIRTLPNYTIPLPTHPTPSFPPEAIERNRQIESVLHGAIYDPYVRWIVLEGIYGWWTDELEEWTTCPQFDLTSKKPVIPVNPTSFGGLVEPEEERKFVIRGSRRGQTVLAPKEHAFGLPFEDPSDVPVCPYHWSAPIHKLNCDFIWPANLTSPHDPKHPGPTPAKDLIELDTPEYAGRIRKDKVIEKLMALGGLRLAGVLNELLGSEEELKKYGARPFLV